MPALTAYQSAFVADLQEAGVSFLVIGGRAMQVHGIERDTDDLDVLVSRVRENSERLHAAIARRMKTPPQELSVAVLQEPQKLVRLPWRANKEVDILTSLGALDFELAAGKSVDGCFGNVTLRVLGLEELVYSKLISASQNVVPETRMRDLTDLHALLSLWLQRQNLALDTGALGRAACAN